MGSTTVRIVAVFTQLSKNEHETAIKKSAYTLVVKRRRHGSSIRLYNHRIIELS